MYRVSQSFWIYNGRKLNEPIEGLYIGPVEKRSFMVVRKPCRYIKDYGTRENFEKNFSVLNDEIVEILRKLGVIEKVIPTYRDKIRITLLDEPQSHEISVHCKPGDLGYNFTIFVGSCSLDETCKTSIPHAHISIGSNYSSRFLITDKKPPQKKAKLKTVSEKDSSLSEIADELINWINAEPIRAFSKGNKTNWDAMRSTWKDIQDIY